MQVVYQFLDKAFQTVEIPSVKTVRWEYFWLNLGRSPHDSLPSGTEERRGRKSLVEGQKSPKRGARAQVEMGS